MRKAQISLEIIIAVSFILLIFLGFFMFYINKNSEIKDSDSIIKMRDKCLQISDALESAIISGNGYSNFIYLNYTARFNEGSITIESDDGKNTVCSYRGDVVSGVYKGKINISNNDNSITIKNA